MTALREHRRHWSQSTPAGADPTAWQLVLWRLLALIAHAMRASADDEHWRRALHDYRRRHPLRAAAYLVAAWVGALLAIEFLALPVVVLLQSLHLRPRGAADFGVTIVAMCGLFALWCAAGRWLRAVVLARVNRWQHASR
jgi:hypothetical protein